MNPAELASLMLKLGITGVDPAKLSVAMQLVESLGGQVTIDAEAVESYYPQINENFYYNAQSLRDASRIGDMRSLTAVNLGKLRKAGWPW